jgi:hypothetical protein
VLTWLAMLVILFEIWYVTAFLSAYAQLRDRLLLLLVGQGLAMIAAFGYLVYCVATGGQFSPVLVMALLLISLVLLLIWRGNAAKLTRFNQSYPRGFVDVLFFRKPIFDLKRRVRTK